MIAELLDARFSLQFECSFEHLITTFFTFFDHVPDVLDLGEEVARVLGPEKLTDSIASVRSLDDGGSAARERDGEVPRVGLETAVARGDDAVGAVRGTRGGG